MSCFPSLQAAAAAVVKALHLPSGPFTPLQVTPRRRCMGSDSDSDS